MITIVGLRILSLIWAFVLLFPLQRLQLVRWSLGGVALPAYYLLIAGPTLVLFIWVWVWNRPRTYCQWAWWIFPVLCLPGIITGLDPLWAARQWASLWLRGLGVGAVLACWPGSARSVREVLKWVYPAAIAACLFGLVEMGTGRNPLFDGFVDQPIARTMAGHQTSNLFFRPPENYAGSQRPMGTQGNRIPFMSCLVPFFPIALSQRPQDERRRWWHFIAAGLLFVLTLWAHVLTAWVGFLTASITYITLSARQNMRRAAQLLSICIALFIGCLCLPPLRGSFLKGVQHLSLQNRDIQHRLGSLPTIQALKGRAAFGVGYGNYGQVYQPYYRGPIHNDASPDNQLLRWLIENGVIAFVALCSFFAALLWWGYRCLTLLPLPDDQELYAGILAACVASLSMLMFFDNFYWMGPNMTTWCFLGLLSTLFQVKRTSTQDQT